jgi:chromosome segregation ATPase
MQLVKINVNLLSKGLTQTEIGKELKLLGANKELREDISKKNTIIENLEKTLMTTQFELTQEQAHRIDLEHSAIQREKRIDEFNDVISNLNLTIKKITNENNERKDEINSLITDIQEQEVNQNNYHDSMENIIKSLIEPNQKYIYVLEILFAMVDEYKDRYSAEIRQNISRLFEEIKSIKSRSMRLTDLINDSDRLGKEIEKIAKIIQDSIEFLSRERGVIELIFMSANGGRQKTSNRSNKAGVSD